MRSEFRPGEIRRLVADSTLMRSTGWRPRVGLEDGIARYLNWVREQGGVRDYFTSAEERLRSKGIVKQVGSPVAGGVR